jgi:ADP-heptose:LPS heptosyltransferase
MPSFLVVQSNNVGDLVLATPLLDALRRRFPGDRIDVLASAYAAPVLHDHPSIDRVHLYRQLKHRALPRTPGSMVSVLRSNVDVLRRLRAMQFDFAFLSSGCATARHLRIARWIAPSLIIGIYDEKRHGPRRASRGLLLQPLEASHIALQSLTVKLQDVVTVHSG